MSLMECCYSRKCFQNKLFLRCFCYCLVYFLLIFNHYVKASSKFTEDITKSSQLQRIVCNFTLYTRGCEDEFGSECVDNSNGIQLCKCKPDRSLVIRGRFCFQEWPCKFGEYWNDFEKKCFEQQTANPANLEKNFCRLDYHCYGNNVKCQPFGFSGSCVCNPGFRYSSNGTCEPMSGIGGHCRKVDDCDAIGVRKMACQKTNNMQTEGTCQCQPEHTYNFDIDGCESNEIISERKRNMRSLIILFIIFGTIFGFAMTFNFGLFAPSPRNNQYLMKRLADEQARYQKRFKRDSLEKIEEAIEDEHLPAEGDEHTSASAPVYDGSNNVNTPLEGTQINHDSTFDTKLVSLD